jgi:hypothetical protein
MKSKIKKVDATAEQPFAKVSSDPIRRIAADWPLKFAEQAGYFARNRVNLAPDRRVARK